VESAHVRRLLGWELLVVLAVFPLGSALVAIYDLVMHLEQGFVFTRSYFVPNQPAATAFFLIAIRLAQSSAVALVFYLLARSQEGPRAIGLGGKRLRTDLALVLPVWFLVFVFPLNLGRSLVSHAGLPTFHVNSPHVPAALLVGLVASLLAGVVEEIVVLGYLVRRLEQRGYSATTVIVIAMVVRVSYHLYYGPGAIAIALWALATVLIYRRIRRLAPFIICHVVWDARITIAHQSVGSANLIMAAFIIAAIGFYLRWRDWNGHGQLAPEALAQSE
jgi:hypothetical protein